MEVFRVTQAKYATSLYASGWEGRWNQEGQRYSTPPRPDRWPVWKTWYIVGGEAYWLISK